jgi:hypothetical protein
MSIGSAKYIPILGPDTVSSRRSNFGSNGCTDNDANRFTDDASFESAFESAFGTAIGAALGGTFRGTYLSTDGPTFESSQCVSFRPTHDAALRSANGSTILCAYWKANQLPD